MFSRPAFGTEKEHTSLVRKLLLGCSVVVTAIILVIMLFHHHEQARAVSGELLNQASSNPLLNNEQTSLLSKVFEYFGGVSYLFPLLIVYVTYKLVYKRLSWRSIDFFVVGTFIVGFNFLVLGLCALMSALFVAGQNGAGGMLGDFISIALSQNLPKIAAKVVPLVLILCGLFLFTHKSPLWFCELLGSLICGNVPFMDKKTEKNTATAEDTEHSAEDDGISITTKSEESVLKKEEKKKEDKKNSDTPVRHDTEPTFGDEGTAPLSASSDLNVNPPLFYKGPTDDLKADVRKSSVSKEPLFKPQQKIEPMFNPNFDTLPDNENKNTALGSVSQSFESSQTPASAYAHNNTQPYGASTNIFSSLSDSKSQAVDDKRPSTYIHTSKRTYPQDNMRANGDLDQPSTIIHTKNRGNTHSFTYQASSFASQGLTNTNISYGNSEMAPTAVASSTSASLFNHEIGSATKILVRNQDKSRLNTFASENQVATAPKTIVTRFVQSPEPLAPLDNKPVSTVITRAPEVRGMNFGTEDVNMYEKDEALGGTFMHKDEDNFEHSAFVPHYEDENENIISFNDVNSESQHTIEVDKLSKAFVPTSVEDPHILDRNTEALISEKDVDYDAYSHGTRGVLPREDEALLKTDDSPFVADTHTNAIFKEEKEEVEQFAKPQYIERQDEELELASQSYSAPESESSYAEPTYVKPQDFTDKASESADSVHSSVLENEGLANLSVKPEENPLTVFPTKKYSCSTQTAPEFIYDDWRPAFSLLKLSDKKVLMDEETVKACIERINKFMHDFKIKAHVERYLSGPVVTQYDLGLEPGVKSSTIRGVQMDLTRNLLVKSVRILDVVPGTPYVGLELPNPKRQLITLGDVVTQDEFTHTKASLPICLGVNVVGKPVVADLAQAPHLLICGTTGSGKSAGVNSMILSLLLACSPAELRLVLIDPKQVEFSLYAGLPHLITPIITETEPALAALDWLVSEMENRYALIRNLHMHNIDECNAIIREANAQGQVVYDPAWTADMGGTPPELKPVPKIVLIIDEFADLMATSSGNKKGSRNLETLLRRLTAKARAAGIHLIMATQTPRAEVVTGVIKANMPSRIAYTVQSGTDSRVILDEPGAENLLGNGDMLVNYQKLEGSKTFRAHGPFACNDDVKNIVKAWIDYAGDPEYIEGVTDYDDESEEEAISEDTQGQSPSIDKIFDQVAQYAREYYASKQKSPPISDIQVNFNVGYARAKRLKMQLIREGVVDE